MKEFSVSEIFGPVQEGEGPFYSGYPTLYVRFARCNLSCPGFNNPNNVDPSTSEVLGFDPGYTFIPAPFKHRFAELHISPKPIRIQ